MRKYAFFYLPLIVKTYGACFSVLERLILTHNNTSWEPFCLDVKEKRGKNGITSGVAGMSGGNQAGCVPVPDCTDLQIPVVRMSSWSGAYTPTAEHVSEKYKGHCTPCAVFIGRLKQACHFCHDLWGLDKQQDSDRNGASCQYRKLFKQ